MNIKTSSEFSNNIDMIEKYKELMKASINGDNNDTLYIRFKNTIEQRFENADFTPEERAKIEAEAMTQFMISTQRDILAAALDWSTKEATLELEKQKLEAEIFNLLASELQTRENANLVEQKALTEAVNRDLINAEKEKTQEETRAIAYDTDYVKPAEIELKNAEKESIKAKNDALIMEAIRMNGRVAGRDANGLPSDLTDEGVRYSSILSTQTDRYVKYATSARENGRIIPSVNSNGFMTGYSADIDGLKYQQTRVAEEQARAFVDSAVQGAVTSSSQLISLALSGEFQDKLTVDDINEYRAGIRFLVNRGNQ